MNYREKAEELVDAVLDADGDAYTVPMVESALREAAAEALVVATQEAWQHKYLRNLSVLASNPGQNESVYYLALWLKAEADRIRRGEG